MKNKNFDHVFISWHRSQRSRNLAEILSLEFLSIQPEGSSLYRFGRCALWTIFQLTTKRPKTIVLQYSFLLLIILAVYKVLHRRPITLICDCHTKALKRSISGKLGNMFNALKKWSFSKTNLCIIHNPEQEADLVKFTTEFTVLHDAIPKIPTLNRSLNIEEYAERQGGIVFVCSYDKDEPIEEMVMAAKILSKTHKVFMTGHVPKKYKWIESNKEITFTGYLSDSDYRILLLEAALIISLTTEEACVQCAAFEAIATENAYLTSNKNALISLLGRSAIYTENNAADIVHGVDIALNNRAALIADMKRLKISLEELFEEGLQEIRQMIF